MDNFRPTSVNILGKTYAIIYVGKASDVDPQGRKTLWGHIDYWERTIRVYENSSRGVEDRLEILLHEIIHHLDEHFQLGLDEAVGDEHKKINMLSVALADILLRNGWLTENLSKEDKNLCR